MTDTSQADRALKDRHRAVWSLGDYPAVALELVADLGPLLVDAVHVRAGERVLDVAAGTGNAALPATRAGAAVVASDLTPTLLEAGRRRAEQEGLALQWREADAEALPFEDGAFDVVLSCIGVMFAPHHRAAADELVRVTRRGGRVGLLSWTPEGFIGQLFAALRPFAPPPPPGASPAPLWGDEQHVRDLLGDRVTGLSARTGLLPVDRFATPQAFRDYFRTTYGPAVAVYRSLGDDADRVAALDAALDELAAGAGAGERPMAWEYLVVTAERT